MALSKELLEILACPKCKGEIFLNRAGDGLICKSCRLVYQIKDDIPVMLIDEALPYKGEVRVEALVTMNPAWRSWRSEKWCSIDDAPILHDAPGSDD